jgi:hypothetical protein
VSDELPLQHAAPDPPSPDQGPPHSPPAPWYPPPTYGYAPTPATSGPSRGFGLAIAAGIVALVLVVGVASYGIGGYKVASDRVSGAAGVINSVDAHRPSINSSFDDVQHMLASPTLVSPSVARSMATEMVFRSQILASTVAGYGPTLRDAQLKLNDLSWLTALSRGRLQDESARLDHARNAVADIKNAAEDYRVFGGFLASYFQVFVDLDSLDTASKNNDSAGYAAALFLLQADVATALHLATNLPYLQSAHRDQLTAIQTEITDIKQELFASAHGDQAGAAAARRAIEADVQKANAVDFSSNAVVVLSHYQHYRDDFNAEMDKATT